MSQLFVNIIGHNSSGKTTLAKKLEKDLSFNRVSGDDFREFIHQNIAYFRDTDTSYPNERYDQLNPLVIGYRFNLTQILLGVEQNVLFDGSGATKIYRSRYLVKIHETFPEIVRVIIWADIAEPELLERLKARGERWLEQYKNLKKNSFQPPEDDEAELVLRYDQNNYDEIKNRLDEWLRR